MPYTRKQWELRIAGRSDLSSQLTHLTRCVQKGDRTVAATKILLKILKERKVRPSTTDSGFICGSIPATCFQDAPLHSIAQNLHDDELRHGGKPTKESPYLGIGLMFSKPYAYRKGARPVIYEDTDTAKTFLPKKEWWRIVRLDLSKNRSFIDWTHEREWRCPGPFEFDLSEATVLLPNEKMYHYFLKRCRRVKSVDILNEIRGVVSLGTVLY